MAIVTGPIIYADGSKYVGNITFRPINPPYYDSTNVILGQDIVVATDGNGNFSQTFMVGVYLVLFSNGNQLTAAVPDDVATHTLASLASNSPAVNFARMNNGHLQLRDLGTLDWCTVDAVGGPQGRQIQLS